MEVDNTRKHRVGKNSTPLNPSGGAGDEHDEVGIVVAGVDEDGHGWVLLDASVNLSPDEWAQLVARLYREHRADRVVAETNFGGAMVESVLRAADPNMAFTGLHASRGKAQRAEPIAALYEQGKVHHLEAFPELEDEMCSFTTGGYAGAASPNRADAMVWCLTELMAQPMKGYAFYELARRMAHGETREAIATQAPVQLQVVYEQAMARIRAGQSPFAAQEGVKRVALNNADYTDRRGGPTGPFAPSTTWINGPNARPTYAPGSWNGLNNKKLRQCHLIPPARRVY